VHSWNIFGAWMNHGQTHIHNTHHDPDLGEATTYFLCLATGSTFKCHFVPRLSSWESRNSQNWDFRNFGGPQLLVQTFNWGEVSSKVVALIKSFAMICGTFQSNEFWPFKLPWEDLQVHWDYNSQSGSSFLHSRKHEMWLPGFTLGPQLCKPLPWSWAQG
jgi:hypothetical protein